MIHAIDCGPLIQVEHIAHAVGGLPPRVLVRTAKHAAQDWWTDDFSAYAPQTIEWLAERGVMLIGLDTPSIDPASSKTLDSHHTILRHDIRVLENLVLDDVPEGDYELIALPLALVQADASPVRAVLRELADPPAFSMKQDHGKPTPSARGVRPRPPARPRLAQPARIRPARRAALPGRPRMSAPNAPKTSSTRKRRSSISRAT